MEKITAVVSSAAPEISSTLEPRAPSVELTITAGSGAGKLQSKMITPSDKACTVTADAGYAGLKSVTVASIPQNYGKITYDGSQILVS